MNLEFSPEEIAFQQKWIDSEQMQRLAEPMKNNGYGKYLLKILNEFTQA